MFAVLMTPQWTFFMPGPRCEIGPVKNQEHPRNKTLDRDGILVRFWYSASCFQPIDRCDMIRSFLVAAVAVPVLTLSFSDRPGDQTPPVTARAPVNTPEQHPEATLSNGVITARVYLPDPDRGFYRSTRFDWSGVIGSLEYRGHQYYGPWFTKTDPPVRDFIYKDNDIIAGAQSAVTGPAEEFQRPQGYLSAKPGGTFVKIGVGVLRKKDEAPYSAYTPYDIVSTGRWFVETSKSFVEFRQEVEDAASGYGYIYMKRVVLTNGKPELVIEHRLTNIGRLPIETNQYNHNFLVLDGASTGPDFVIAVPFRIKTARPPDLAFAEIKDKEILYRKVLTGQDRVTFPLEGFGSGSRDYDIRIENRATGAGVRVTGDRPLASLPLWSIRSVISMEPFVNVNTDVGKTTTWKYTYTYYVKDK
jgi:hypothetical protein